MPTSYILTASGQRLTTEAGARLVLESSNGTTDSIKKRIMDRLVTNLSALIPSKFRGVTREMDPLAASEKLPALMIYDGEETEIEKDHFGRTYNFPVVFKILAQSERNLAAKKDELVPEVQRIVEGEIQLNGLANIVEGGTEQPFINELGKPVGGALLFYTVQYRRKLGDPYTTY